jgi:hypothetical protein
MSSLDKESESLEERCKYNEKRRLIEYRENIARRQRRRQWI